MAIALIAATASCQTDTSPAVFFPKLDTPPGDPVQLAKVTGNLAIEQGCLWLVAGPERFLLVWPSTYQLVSRNGRVVIVGGGAELAAVGDRVGVLGGELRAQPEAPGRIDSFVESEINTVVPGECRRGLYWEVTGIEHP